MSPSSYPRSPPRAKSAPPLSHAESTLDWSDDSDQPEDEQEDDMDAGERVGPGKSEPETGSLKFEHKKFKNTQSPKEADFYLHEQRARLLNKTRYQCDHELDHLSTRAFNALQNEIAMCTDNVFEQIDMEKQPHLVQMAEELVRCQEKILNALEVETRSWHATKVRWIDERKRLKEEVKQAVAKSVSAADRKMNDLKKENRKLKGMIAEQRQAVFLMKYAQTHKDSQEWDYDISDAADDVAQVRVELLRSRIEFVSVSRKRGEVSRPNIKERILEELHRILNAEWATDQEEMARFYYDRGLSLLMKDAEAAVARPSVSVSIYSPCPLPLGEFTTATMPSFKLLFLLAVALLVLCPAPAAAFGAGNIASISTIEGKNWRHGDIEDMLKTVACLKGHKWSSMMIKRVYFGNWLRDYSQAVDVGTLKGVQADTIRILVWILAFMSFGYATKEFEVTHERLGVYRPEEHIDNPKDYADNQDARQYDSRLRGPVSQEELDIDPQTGMKNYIANERGGWATSAGYIRHSFKRAIHYGRMYTHGAGGSKGREEDLCEALRCLGQGLHCIEDFGAHTNYTELALRELGFHNVFPHTGTATQMNLHGKHVFPLVTGTFGGVDFLHSVLGEATDHFTQSNVDTSEIDELNLQLGNASGTSGKRSSGGSAGGDVEALTSLLSKIPGTGSLCKEAAELKASSDAQAAENARMSGAGYGSSRADPTFAAPPGSVGGPPGPGIPGMSPDFDPQSMVPKIYPILEFRDKVVRAISSVISKIPGLESLVEKISERVTMFVFALLAPFVQPIIAAASKQLKTGSSAVIDASGKHQYEPWTDPHCTDPTHSLLSKDHFSNILNEPAGQIASAILQYVAPRVIYAMDHPNVPVDEVLNDVVRVFHHPALRDRHCELHRNMFSVVEKWVHSRSDRGHGLNNILSSESVRAGKNHSGEQGGHGHGHGGHGHGGHGGYAAHTSSGSGGGASSFGNLAGLANLGGSGGGSSSGGVGGLLGNIGKLTGGSNPLSSFLGGSGGKREVDSPPQSYSPGPPQSQTNFHPYGEHYAQSPGPHGYQYQQDAPLPPGPPQNNPADPYAFPSQYQQGWQDGGPPMAPYGQQPPPPHGGYGGPPPDQYGQQGHWGQQQQPPPPPGGYWGGQY
ncbi:Heterokaryon incompatibility protein [Lasiodiplodia theobromae]|uniref:Heterokaryon incompatibility protein n=1 Tax=Lasiodiplodia theobromae TaxID=45133 RepID=UPI0015C405B2|nr:Heterokaryon incompatibility protein [Lasiodiplodia theobromae]KAF4540457.1 Heterokaryon incompatibility protein [Lasiodiplodia theobromae]